MQEELIPHQQEGGRSDTESKAQFDDEAAAQKFFAVVSDRLLDVNSWHRFAGKATAAFHLRDAEGQPSERKAQVGDHIEIDIPGPGSDTGAGSDWVRIEEINFTNKKLFMTVRPVTNPLNDRNDVAHFFDEGATSTFKVTLEDKTVTAGVHGRNEKPNTNTETLTDKIRNTAVATVAIGLFSKIQWKSLVNGLVEK